MNTRHALTRALAFAMTLILASGCEPTPGTSPAKAPSQTSSQAADQAADDAAGRVDTAEVIERRGEVPAQPVRIVSLAPNVTEVLFALGLGDRMVGVTKFCDFPPAAKALQKVGGYIDPDLEAIMSTHPDLVVGMQGAAVDKVGEGLERAGIPMVVLRMRDVSETVAGIAALGEAVGAPKKAKSMAGALRATLSPAPLPEGADRPRVLFVLGHKPLIVAGPGTFGHELIELAGGVNAAGGLETAYPQVDVEKVIELAPEIVIDTNMGQTATARDAFWARFETIPAVRDGRITTFDDPSLLRQGPRLAQALDTFVGVISAPTKSP